MRVRPAGGREPRPARIAAHVGHPLRRHAPRAGRRLHGRDLGPPDRARGCLPVDAGTGRDQLRHGRGLRAARRDAHDDDHRPEADQDEQAGALPDCRRGRHDATAHEVHALDRRRRRHPGARARGVPHRAAGAPGRGPPRAPGRHRARGQRRGANSRELRPAARGRREVDRARRRGDRARASAARHGRRRREPQAHRRACCVRSSIAWACRS